MSAKRSSQTMAQKSVLAMPTRPLGLADRGFVEDALADVAPDWSVDLDGICEDEATIILLPEGADDLAGPSFVISRESFGFRLDQLHWDTMHEVGTYAELADAVSAVGLRLATGSFLSLSASSTRH